MVALYQQKKTAITHIRNGFTFLGQTFRKHGNVLHIIPSTEGVLALKQKLGDTIREYVSAPMPALIKKLNQMLRGWGNYHRHVVASEAFSCVDTYVYEQLWRMLRRRHPQEVQEVASQEILVHSGTQVGVLDDSKDEEWQAPIHGATSQFYRHSPTHQGQGGGEPVHARIWRLLLAPSARPSLASFSCSFGKRISGHDHIIEVQQPGRPRRASFWNA